MAASPSDSSLFPGGGEESARLGRTRTRRRRTSAESIGCHKRKVSDAVPVVSTRDREIRVQVAVVVVGRGQQRCPATTHPVPASRRSLAPRFLQSRVRRHRRRRCHSAHRVWSQHYRMATHHRRSPPPLSGPVGGRIRQVQGHARIQVVSSQPRQNESWAHDTAAAR